MRPNHHLLIVLFLLGSLPMAVWGQACGRRGPYLSVYAGPMADVGLGSWRGAVMGGVTGGVGIDDKVYIGAYFSGLMSQNVNAHFSYPLKDSVASATLSSSQFGITFQYSPWVRPFARLLIGGRAGVSQFNWYDRDHDHNLRASVMTVSPSLSLEFPAFNYSRLELGVAYRSVGSLNLPKNLNSMSGFYYFAVLRFGSF